ncbi:type II toxin-antitoxin system VapB family antitoxin [Leptospira bandrabouensis]|uniref:type II toxin-antitoxin system VapB family antitoxin n=1 Tax=Leptospira bandrabouensis TaxID=2484903 RepID=UPI001EEB8F5C|nr:type II toxin-antitoxin system VapB family antitoxin [Leptospira bandrabouensis]MCG6146620.1 type II toxin-antitoxin system VapB family antitoxin [Leptospira bandrabouensis]MCG6166193.1 type II toxin-antitoxin system VapB family antitoxin [Leptospira bandrabouensis]
MATNLNIDPKLLDEAYSISGLKTKRETVNTALVEFIKKHKQKDIIKFFNSIEYDPKVDYKKLRK